MCHTFHNMKRAASAFLATALFLAPALALAAESITTGFLSTSGGYTGGIFGGGGFFGFGGSCAGSTLACVGMLIIDLINRVLVPVLFAVAFIVFLWGVAKAYIISVGDEEEVKKGHKLILWGLIGFAVMISVWGLVNIVVNTLGLFGGGTLPAPTSPYPATG